MDKCFGHIITWLQHSGPDRNRCDFDEHTSAPPQKNTHTQGSGNKGKATATHANAMNATGWSISLACVGMVLPIPAT